MDREEIELLLRRLSELLARRGVVGEIALYGGAAMVLAHRARLSTKDVDAVFVPKQEVYQAAAEVAAACHAEEDWLNDAVKGFLSDRNETSLLTDLPGLKVFVASPEYLLAMKCLSMRLGKEETDLEDVRFLMDHLDLREAKDVLDLVSRYYPEDRIQPKTRFAVEEICQQLNRT
ncbi:MAG: DUF6036 family nucleotidyltransferase [Akkermansiaceae bacterium]